MQIGPVARALGDADPILRCKVGEDVRQALQGTEALEVSSWCLDVA
jgi:hypothetical protein